MTTLRFAAPETFRRILTADGNAVDRAAAFASLCRINTLYMIKRAGSGHLGTSFSCMDVLSWLHLAEMDLDRDICFSSKGHDVPAFYAVLSALGRLEFDKIHGLRRLGGLPGHPDVSVPGLHVNSGSLGMGISKAKGLALASRHQRAPGRVFVITGDGELGEGQIWESLPSAVNQGLAEITAIVDCNKIQSDTWCRRVSDLGDLVAKFRSFGWYVARCNGHDFESLRAGFESLRDAGERPKVLVADTVKGKGVSFMEEFGPEENFYGFHSGAPTDEAYMRALDELRREAERCLRALGIAPLDLESTSISATHSPLPRHKLVDAYATELVRHAERRPEVVVLDADLVKDCGLMQFADKFPERLVECGIAEQDMVSQAGGLALRGMLPIVHSFSAFLSARPNEQIYTNATERTKVVYVATLAGLLPGTPGHSHQSVRDISALAAVPGLTMIAPATEREVALALDWCLDGSTGSCYLRLCSIPSIIPYPVPPDLDLQVGRGWVLAQGGDAVVFAYGPVMTAQAYLAGEELRQRGLRLTVVNLPWLNRVDPAWLLETVRGAKWVFTVDDHYVKNGQGEMLLSNLAEAGWPAGLRARRFGVTRVPACGQNDEVLSSHGLDASTLAAEISKAMS